MTYELNNEDQLYDFLETFVELKRRLVPIAKILCKQQGINANWLDEEDIIINDYNDCYYEHTYYHCGSSDTEKVHIPIQYLFKEDWIQIEQEKIEAEKQKKLKQEEERKRKAEQAELEREKKLYLELQKKYG